MTGGNHDSVSGRGSGQAAEAQRLDKWLWFARVAKSRTLAAQLVQDGKVRINRVRAAKPSQTVRPGDVLTIALRGNIEVLKVLAPGARRGPPAEARQLYEALASLGRTGGLSHLSVAPRQPGTGRPTKRERRLTNRLTTGQNS
jgi:ribosome-associated heat shock protein Hsp15